MKPETEQPNVELDDCWNRIGVWSPESASCPELQQVTHCRNCKVYSAAGRRILERDPPTGYRQEWTAIYARQKDNRKHDLTSVVIFRLGDDWLSLGSHLVQEITEMRPIHSLPHHDRGAVKGLVNIRGELRICISLGNLLGLQQGELTSNDLGYDVFARMVLIAQDKEQYVFPVTEVYGTHRFDSNQLQATPTTIAKAKVRYTKRILEWQQKHVACLDEDLLLYSLKKGLS